MRKLAYCWIILAVVLLLGSASMAMAEDGRNISVTEMVASSTTDPACPPEYLTDSDDATFWRLADGSNQGWVAFKLGKPFLIDAILLKGQLAFNTKLSLEYYKDGFWFPFVGANYSTIPSNGRINLADERVVTDCIRVSLKGSDAAFSILNELGIIGREASTIYHRIKIKSVTGSNNTSYLTRADFLTDGNSNTYWMTKPSYRSNNNWLFETVEKYNGLTNQNPNLPTSGPYSNHGDVVVDLGSTFTLESIKIFFTKDTRGNMTIEAFDGSQWKAISTVPERRTPGWYRVVPSMPVTAQKIRLSMDVACLDSVGGISEVEIWGRGNYQGNEHILVGSQDTRVITEPINRVFSVKAQDVKGYVLNLALDGIVTEAIRVDLNGFEFTLQPSAQIRGNTLYRLSIDSESILDGMNYLRIYPQTTAQTLTYAGLIREGDGVQKSLTGDTISSSNNDLFISLSDKTTVEAIEVLAENPVGISGSVGEYQIWQSFLQTESGSGWIRFKGPITGNQIRISNQAGINITSIRILGSPLTNKAPTVKIGTPIEGQTFNVNNNIGAIPLGGYIDNPNAKVTINGMTPFQIGQYFGMQLVSLGVKPYEKTDVEAVVTDPEGRVSRHKIAVFVGNAPFVTLNQAEQIAYSTRNTYTISGNIAVANCTVKVNGQTISGKMGAFSANLNLVEGYNRIKVEGFYQNGNQQFSEIQYRSVVYRASGSFNLTIDSPSEGDCLNRPNVIVSGSVEGLGQTSVTVNGKPATVNGSYYRAEISLLEGANTIAVIGKDAFDGVSEKKIGVVMDSKPPVIDGIIPQDGAILASNTVDVLAHVSDDHDLTVLINGQAVAGDHETYRRTLTFQADGVQMMTIRARDRAGNTCNISLKITTDTQAPLPFEVKANPSGWTNNNRPTLTFATTDTGSGVDHYELSMDQGPYQQVASPFLMPVQTDGEHLIMVKAFDKAGLVTIASAKIYIDTTPPAVPPNFRTVPGNGKMILRWDSPSSDVVIYKIERDAIAVTLANLMADTLEYQDMGLENGRTFKYRIIAIDRAGNRSTPSQWMSGVVGLTVTSCKPNEGTIVEFEDVTLMIKPNSVPENVQSIKVTEIQSQDLDNKAAFSIIGPIYQFSTSVTVNQQDYNLDHMVFTKEYVGSLKYDPEKVPEGVPDQNLGVYYYDPMWSRWFKVPESAVDVQNHKIYFVTNHFSSFSIQPTMLEDLSPQELKDVGYSPLKSTSTHGGVTVSPEGGSASVSMTELVLPGKNGFDFVLKRYYDSSTARGDAAGISVNIQLGISLKNLFNESTYEVIDEITKIGEQVLDSGVGSVMTDLESKVKKVFQNNGDYAYSMGLGWRLNVPYIMGSNCSILLRMPNGSIYSMNRLNLSKILEEHGDSRKLRFVNHEGEDFTLYVEQVRGDISITDLIRKGDSQIIPGWVLKEAKLILKDGTTYEMDRLGRVTKITDKTGLNTIQFKYQNLQLDYIQDSMGRKIRFEYDDRFLLPKIKKIWIDGDNRSINYETSKKIGGGQECPVLTKATDIGGREWNYDYTHKFLLSGMLGVKVNVLQIILDICSWGTSSFWTGMDDITIKNNTQCEWIFPLTEVEGPGIGCTQISYDQKALKHIYSKKTDYFLGVIPISFEVDFELSQRLLVNELQVFKTRNDLPLSTIYYNYNLEYHSHEQYINKQTIEEDGRKRTVYSYDATTKKYIRFIDFTDYAAEIINGTFSYSGGFNINGLLIEDPYSYDVTSFLESKEIHDLTSDIQILLESTKYTYNLEETMRPLTETTHHGYWSEGINYAYDKWGNIIYQKNHSESNGRTNETEVWMHYYNSGSELTSVMQSHPSPYSNPPIDEEDARHDLLLYKVVANYAPKEVSGVSDQYLYSSYEYNDLGLKTGEAQWDGSRWLKTQYQYNLDHGNLIAKIDPLGHRTDFEYDQDWNYPTAVIERFVKDIDGNITDIATRTGYDFITGNKLWQKNPRGYVTTYNYDLLGRTTQIIAADDDDDPTWIPDGTARDLRTKNPTTTIQYDDAALTSLVTDPLGRRTLYDFDELGRLVEIIKYERDGSQYKPYALTDIEYNSWGDITGITDPNRNKTEYTYDAMGRNKEIIYPKASYETKNPNKKMDFDYIENILTITDGLENITTVYEDMQGRAVKQIQKKDDAIIKTEHYYDGLGNEVMTVDPNGHKVINIYDERNLLVKTVLPQESFWENGRLVTATPYKRFEYDAVGRKIAEVVNTPGNGELASSFTLDEVGRIIRTGVPYTDNGEKKTAITTIYYDANGNKTKVVDANYSSLPVDQQKGLSYTYSATDLLLKETDLANGVTSYTYDAVGNRLTMTDPRGNCVKYAGDFTIVYEYDDLNRLIDGYLPKAPGQTEKPKVTLTYDPRGNLLERLEPDGLKTVYTYTPQNKLWTETLVSNDGQKSYKTEHRYDAAGNETQIIDPRGNMTEKKYDTFNRLTDIVHPENPNNEYESFEYDANGNRTGYIDGRRHLTNYQYDAYNRLISVTNYIETRPIVTSYRYDRLGNMTWMEDGMKYVTTYAYDELNRLLTETDPEQHTKTYCYDAVGNRLTATDPNGTTTTYHYTDHYLVESITLANTAQNKKQTLKYQYDEAGFRISASLDGVDTTYNTVNNTYTPDPYGRIHQESKSFGGKTLTVGYDYDVMGRMTKLTYPTGYAVDYKYNEVGQLTGVPGFVDQEPIYNVGGLLESLMAANGVTTTYAYDKNNRLSSLNYADFGKNVLKYYTYKYDGANNIIERTKNGYTGMEAFQYDDLNQLICASLNGNFENNAKEDKQATGSVIDDQLGKKSMQIDPLSRIELLADQLELFQLDYAAGSIGVDLKSSVRLSRLILTPNSPTHRVNPRNISIYVSDDNMNYTKATGWKAATLKNGGYEIVFKTAVQGRYIKVHCHYDDRDKQYVAYKRNNQAFANFPDKLIKVYFYVANRIERYEYDDNGNRTAETIAQGNPVIRGYAYYENSNKLKADTRYTYEYDSNGNLIKKTSMVGEPVTWEYGYDLLNRLIQVTKNEKVVASYTYDDGGLRIAKKGAEGKQTCYVFDVGGNIIYEQEDKDYQEYVYVLGKHFARVDGKTDTTETTKYFYQTDHLGSTVMVTDKDGKQVWSGEYTPFGTVNSEEGELKNAAKFTGKDLDEDTGLYYFNARWYDPDTGRFVSEDPGVDPYLYAYCGNNPLTKTDPTGFGPEDYSNRDWINYCKTMDAPRDFWGKLFKGIGDWFKAPAASNNPKELLEKRSQGVYGFLYDYCNGMMFGADVAALYDRLVAEKRINPKKYSREQFANDIGPLLEMHYANSTTKGQEIQNNVTFYANMYIIACCVASMAPSRVSPAAQREGEAVAEMEMGSLEAAVAAEERNLLIQEREFDNLAKFRKELNLPVAGSSTDKFTIAKLEVSGQEYYGISAHGQKVNLTVNPISRTHAEADVFQQAANFGIKGGKAILVVDRDLCIPCGPKGAVISMARQLGITELTIISPSGVKTISIQP